MGQKAVIGAVAAVVFGLITYYLHGKKNTSFRPTPFTSFRQQFRSPTSQELARREAAFHVADKGGTGYLNLDEFHIALNYLGFPHDEEESKVLFTQIIDIDEDGELDIEEFMQYFEWGRDAISNSE